MKKILIPFIAFLLAATDGTGQVGIGTTNPTAQLELTQSLRFPATTTSTTGIIFKGESRFLHDYKGPIALGFNTFLGVNAGNFTSGGGGDYQGCNNTGIGYQSLYLISTGYANTALGAFSLQSNTTGFENTAAGLHALNSNTSGQKNTAIGYMANYFNQTGSSNTTIGFEAGKGTALHNKSGNVFIGYQAGFNETGSNKLYIENSNSSTPLIGGDFTTNVAFINGSLGIGISNPASTLHVAGTMRIADGTQGTGKLLISDANGTATWTAQSSISDGDWTVSGTNLYPAVSGHVGIGVTNPIQQLELSQSMSIPTTTSGTIGVIYKGDVPFIHNYFKSPGSFDFNTFIGLNAGNFSMGGASNYHGTNNTAVGYTALHSVTNGYANTANGVASLAATTSGYENTAAGLHSMYTNQTGIRNTGIGVYALYSNSSGSQNTVLGMSANYYNQTGTNNTMVGYEAGKGTALHSKSGNIFIGFQAGINETGSNKLYIENSSSSSPLIGGDFSTDVAFINGKLGVGTSNPGQQLEITQSIELPPTSSSTAGVIYKDDNRFIHNFRHPSNLGNNTFVGVWAGNFTMTGPVSTDASNNVGVGTYALTDNTTGSRNTAAGYEALSNNTTGVSNTALGHYVMRYNTTGNYNTSVGEGAGYENVTGFNGCYFGNYAGPGNTSPGLNYSGAFGAYTLNSADFQFRIGGTATLSIGGYVGWTNLSDGRFKENIEANVKGLDFVMKLNPVTFTLNTEKIAAFSGAQSKEETCVGAKAASDEILSNGRRAKSQIRYTGFIAQEVEQAAREAGFDFSGIDPPKNEHDMYGLRYAEFVVPLVKAVQEQQQMISDLKDQNVLLLKLNDELTKRIEVLENK